MDDEQFKQHLEELIQDRITDAMNKLTISVRRYRDHDSQVKIEVILWREGREISRDNTYID